MAMILDAFLSKFSELLKQMVHDEMGMLLGIPGQIEKLGNTVGDIQLVLADAEMKQSNDRAIEHWLMQLKDVMYDADDVIDLCQIKAKERLPGSSSYSSSNARCGYPLLSCFRNPFFAHEIGSKIKDINSRLEEIAKRRADLDLTASQILPGPSRRVRRVDSPRMRKTECATEGDGIVGEKIEEDTVMLVKWLTEEEKGVRENVRVVVILGMGGIGKTTLACKIFFDPRIEDEFELKFWLCVSKEVNDVELLKWMIWSARGEPGDANKRSELVPILERLVQKKKYLLVLDDVWEESQAVWDSLLRAPMSGGAYGSRLLITTRDERVTNVMRASKWHRVDKLSDKDGWSLLIKQVHPNGIESDIEDHREIGMQIVKKCDGLPLAIKSIGGELKWYPRENWHAILRSNEWSMDGLPGDVHRAIYLSYEDLTPPLKQCFIFCSLFPKDFVFNKVNLIYMWQGEGFLPDKGDFWELGHLYYTELLLRNLLEDTNNNVGLIECKMHELVWSFARQLGKNENCQLREGQAIDRFEGSMKVRRLSIEGNEVNTEVIKKEKGLRTLLLRNKSEVALDDLCKAFSKLRILDLCKSNISSLPDSLFGLVHLRYLDVSGSKLRNIPNSIKNLRNLACFWCTGCTELSHISQSISNLQELRCLGFENTNVEAIPTGLSNLEMLTGLYGFKPYKNNLEGFSSLDGLESLSQLIELHLDGLERVSDRNIAKRADLKSKNELSQLYLTYTLLSSEEQLSQTDEMKMITEDVLNELCPPRYVEDCVIKGYFGRCLPNWLNLGASLPNLKYLTIENCACFEGLAPLGQLPNLDILRLKDVYSVVSVGEEFLWGDIQNRVAFPKLSELFFIKMTNWKEWQWNKEQPAMPKLKKLFIESCPLLRYLPDGLLYHTTSLELLDINQADNLIFIEHLPSIKEIAVYSNPILERISNLPSITDILISECPNLKSLENLISLEKMVLIDFEMKTLPEYLATTMSNKLTIRCSEELFQKIVSEGESGFEWNRFKHIPKVTIYSLDESFHATYQKTPFSFSTNISTRLSN